MEDSMSVEEQGNKVNEAVDRWFFSHIHGSVVGHSTEAYNHVRASLGELKADLAALCKKEETR
jgi:hypothetical protein